MPCCTANPPTNIVDFRGFDSSIILNLRIGILRPKGNFLESLTRAMLEGIMLEGRLGVAAACQQTFLHVHMHRDSGKDKGGPSKGGFLYNRLFS